VRFPNKLYLQKLKGRGLWDHHEHVGMTTFGILDGIA